MLHLNGPVLTSNGDGGWRELPEAWIVDGRIRYHQPDGGAQPSESISGWAIPGLVDVHAHIGLGPGGEVSHETAVEQGLLDVRKGVLLVRDAGSPQDTRWAHERADMPRLLRAGRHIARPKRYTRNFALELPEVADLPQILAEQARYGDGWVKIIADWIDRENGVLTPLWPNDVLADAVAAAHENGARVAAHTFSHEAVDGLLAAGVDCIEHGTGMDPDHIAEAARRGIAVTPTMIQIDRFDEFAQRGLARFPNYAAQMRAMYARREEQFHAFVDAGLTILPGSDAGGELPHGLAPRELARWVEIGLDPADALYRGTIGARQYLAVNPHRPVRNGSSARRAALSVAESRNPVRTQESQPGSRELSQDGTAAIGWLRDGDPADLVLYPSDPREDIAALGSPSAIILRGALVN